MLKYTLKKHFSFLIFISQIYSYSVFFSVGFFFYSFLWWTSKNISLRGIGHFFRVDFIWNVQKKKSLLLFFFFFFVYSFSCCNGLICIQKNVIFILFFYFYLKKKKEAKINKHSMRWSVNTSDHTLCAKEKWWKCIPPLREYTSTTTWIVHRWYILESKYNSNNDNNNNLAK